MKIAILISGGGSNMQSLIAAMQDDPNHEIALVLSNRPNAGGLAKAASADIATTVVDHKDFGADRDGFEDALAQELAAHQIDMICLAGFMRILTPGFVRRWPGKILNIHPSLLPKYAGLNTHARALESGDAEHGCSVHVVIDELDAGPILGQARLAIDSEDSPQSLASRVLALEHALYPLVLKRYLDGDNSRLDM